MSGNIAERLAGISPEKRKLLEILLKEEGVDLGHSVIVPQPRTKNLNAFPVSFAQERLWFLDQLEPNSPRYNIPLALEAHGRLNVPALEEAIRDIVRRHEILRTTFTEIRGELMQIISPEITIPLQKIDMRGQPETAVHDTISAEAIRPFSLTAGPLFRLTLIQRLPEVQLILLTMHHIISDGWSMGILIRELAALYAANLDGRTAALPSMPLQYADFSHWQREWLQGDVLDSQLQYWKDQLSGAPPLLQLSTDRPRPAVSTNRGGCVRFSLSRQLTRQLRAVSTHEGDTLFMTMLAAFQTLLYRYTGQANICLGTPIANRNRQEIEGLIGFFVNTLVIRTNFAHEPTFCQILEQVRATTLNAYANQDLPFELLVDALHPERNLSHSPLFQVMFAWQNASPEPLTLPELTLRPLPTQKNIATFDLTLNMAETEDGISGTLEYNCDLFDETTINRLVGHLTTLLTAVAHDVHQPVATLPIFTLAEQQQLASWNETTVAYDLDQPIHKLIEAQVKRCPSETAVYYEGTSLTFDQLNQRANQLARYLQKQGLAPDGIVGIYLEPSLEMLVAVLGTLKAGGAYLPLDPTYPTERLSHMLTDADPAIVLTHDALLNSSKKIANSRAIIVNLEADWAQIALENQTNPASRSTAGSLAYIIYTSGSTGQPKGTLLMHRGLCNLAMVYQEHLNLGPGCRLLRFFSFCFDGSVGDIFSALISGAALYLPPRETILSPPDLHRYIQDHQISHILMTPSLLAVLPTHNLPNLRMVLAGGEQLTRQVAARWLPGRRILNAYGPTETTIVSVLYRFEEMAELPPTAVAIPIGLPVANTHTYILDKAQQPLPVGVPGELYIAGVGLARGYLNRPELTAEKFVRLPSTSNPYVVIDKQTNGSWPPHTAYRTGDLCRYLPDGNIEYLGRLDHQVKLRGFRIELGEIEALLQRNEAVDTAVVLLREDEPDQKRLVAYVVARPDVALAAQTLHDFLADHLPTYMLPTAFVQLDQLPRLPNGKVNRAALPQPSGTHDELVGRYVAPRTPNEELLAGVWTQLLPAAEIGIHDNFFELGGHSLMATQLISRLRDLFQVELPLRDLFAAPTIAELAQNVAIAQQAQSHSVAPAIEPVQDRDELPLSFAQQRLWFLNQLEPDGTAYNIPQAVRLNGRLQIDALEKSLNQIIARHESLRTTFVTVDGQPRLHLAAAAALAIEVVDLRHLPPDQRKAEATKMGIAEAQRPFNISQAPLLRAKLLQLAEDDFIALLTMHHIISDGWSMGVLIRELLTFYTAVVNQKPASLPELPIQYGDYAQWQRQWLTGSVLDSQLDYWRQQLANLAPLLELPTDRPRPAVQTSNGAHQSFTLSLATRKALKRFSQAAGSTLFMTLLAAFQTLLYRYTGQGDIAVGTPIANRKRAEVEGLIGFFVNTLVLRSQLAGKMTFSELLHQVRQTALAAYAHQDLPFDKLVDSLQPERNLSHTPLFQVMFILQNAPLGAAEMPGVTLRPFPLAPGIATFDLSLVVEETEDGLAAAFEYNTDLFDDSTIARLIGHFQTLLAGILAAPDTPLASLPLLTEAERHQLLVAWNETAVPLPTSPTLYTLFEAQVARTPNAVAAICGPNQLTYAGLNEQANRLAHYLQRQGVSPGEFVGVALERSLEMLVGLLGILKAGAAYLPLDPDYPPDRLAFMIEDANPTIILTHQAAQPEQRLTSSGGSTFTTVNLDKDWPQIDQEAATNPLPQADGRLAYLIYTSGSTGQPKGVPVSHRAAVNHNLAVIELFKLQPSDRVWQFATINFDTAVEEIFPTLLCGASLVLRPAEIPPVSELCRLVAEQQLTVLDLPTAYWHAWVHDLGQSGEKLPDCLRFVAVGGEKASAEAYKLWQTMVNASKTAWLNGYGPTETAIISTAFLPDGKIEGEVPIGRPLANTQLYVLDSNMEPVPIGVPGELYIAGAGLAEGYLNRPELTAARFVKLAINRQPFTDDPSPFTAYRTGDLVRYRPDGNLEYLGRLDNQVKVRGFRIELGEIEACLEQHEGVRETAVLLREADREQKRLVAYVVPVGPAPTVTDLRHHLEAKLPNYMLPAAFVFLDSLPLMPNGKIDRHALPAPDSTRPELASAWAEPTTDNEKLLATIWQALLGLEKVGIHDNFFELGGDSILTIQVIARAKQGGLHLTARQFFAGATIAELAAVASRGQTVQAEQGMVTGPIPLTPIQHWFFDQDFSEPHHWNQALLLTVSQPLERESLATAVAHLLHHHDALRLRFYRIVSGWEQSNEGVPEETPLFWLDLSGLTAGEQLTAATNHAAKLQASLNLTEGPLFLAAYFDLGLQGGRLLLAAHHLIIDGVSWRIILEDLQALYAQLSQQLPPQLPPKTTAFLHWANRLAQYAQSETIQTEVDHWLARSSDTRPLPRDFAGGQNLEASAENVSAALSITETAALLREVPSVFRTEVNDVLLTALAQAVAAWTGRQAVLVDLETHGRAELFEDVDLSRTVGWFTAVYPLSLIVPGQAAPETTLKLIKEQLRRIPHLGIGYGLLRYLNQDESVVQTLSRQPQAELCFNYLGQIDQTLPEASPFGLAPESRGPDRSLQGQRQHLLDVTAVISQGQLHVNWTYSRDIYQSETVEQLAQAFITALRALISRCQAPDAGGVTPSDFPVANIDQKKLDRLMQKIKQRQKS